MAIRGPRPARSFLAGGSDDHREAPQGPPGRAGGVAYETVDHPRTATASETAQAAHIPGSRLAKTVVIHLESGPVLAVVPSSHRVDLGELQSLLDRRLGLASETEIGAALRRLRRRGGASGRVGLQRADRPRPQPLGARPGLVRGRRPPHAHQRRRRRLRPADAGRAAGRVQPRRLIRRPAIAAGRELGEAGGTRRDDDDCRPSPHRDRRASAGGRSAGCWRSSRRSGWPSALSTGSGWARLGYRAGVLANPRPALRAVRGGLRSAGALLLAEPALGPADGGAGAGRPGPRSDPALAVLERSALLRRALPGLLAFILAIGFAGSWDDAVRFLYGGPSGSWTRCSAVTSASTCSGCRCSRRSCAGSSSSRSACCRPGGAGGRARGVPRLGAPRRRGAGLDGVGARLEPRRGRARGSPPDYVLDRFRLLYASERHRLGPRLSSRCTW